MCRGSTENLRRRQDRWPWWQIPGGHSQVDRCQECIVLKTIKKGFSFLLKWNDHFILAKMKRIPLHSGRNGHLILARMKWNAFHSGQSDMGFISFRQKWNGHFMLNQIKWHSFHFYKNHTHTLFQRLGCKRMVCKSTLLVKVLLQ